MTNLAGAVPQERSHSHCRSNRPTGRHKRRDADPPEVVQLVHASPGAPRHFLPGPDVTAFVTLEIMRLSAPVRWSQASRSCMALAQRRRGDVEAIGQREAARGRAPFKAHVGHVCMAHQGPDVFGHLLRGQACDVETSERVLAIPGEGVKAVAYHLQASKGVEEGHTRRLACTRGLQCIDHSHAVHILVLGLVRGARGRQRSTQTFAAIVSLALRDPWTSRADDCDCH